MTDSGGFQVFQLGLRSRARNGEVRWDRFEKNIILRNQTFFGSSGPKPPPLGEKILRMPSFFASRAFRTIFLSNLKKNLVRVTEDGAHFNDDYGESYLDAETSIKIQEKLGGDIIVAFDEPTSPLHDYKYTKESLERTNAWALRSLKARTRKDQ